MDENGSVMNRPLLCAPDLVCTGDVEPTPYTCVKRRPANTCYQVCICALQIAKTVLFTIRALSKQICSGSLLAD